MGWHRGGHNKGLEDKDRKTHRQLLELRSMFDWG